MARPLLALTVALLLQPTPARAVFLVFTLDPAQSFAEIQAGSGLSLGLPAPLGPLALPFESQLGVVAGVAGGLLADGTTSDGLRTTLSGTVLMNLDLPGSQLQFLTVQTLITPDASGTWGPGPPADPGTPDAAQAGVHFEESALGITGNAALRDTAITFFSTPHQVTDQGGGLSTFQNGIQRFSFASGGFDYETNVPSVGGRGFFDTTEGLVDLRGGTLEDLGGGVTKLVLAFQLDLFVTESAFGAPIPTSASVQLAGEIVAFHGVPEPSTAGLLACATLAACGWVVRCRRGQAA